MRNLCSLSPNSNFPFVFTGGFAGGAAAVFRWSSRPLGPPAAFSFSDCAVFINNSYSSPVMLFRSLSILNNSSRASLADQAGMTGAAKPPSNRAHCMNPRVDLNILISSCKQERVSLRQDGGRRL